MNIYQPTQYQIDNFKPTFLYLKRHKDTKLLYFGKTTRTDPVKYNGSGKYWKNHLKKYGKNIETIWYEKFYDIYELINFALSFSEIFDITNSELFANLCEENGLDGGNPGKTATSKTALALKGRKRSQNSIDRQKKTLLENPIIFTEERKEKISKSLTGKKLSKTHIDALKLGSKTEKNIESRKRNFDRTGKIPWNKGIKTGPKKIKILNFHIE
jgi:hypothetical protein